MAFLPSLPKKSGLLEVFKLTPEGWLPLFDYHDWLLRGPSPLSIGAREMIASYVSKLNGCQFCYGAHSTIAARYGIEPEVLDTLVDDLEGADIDDSLKPILRYAGKLTLDQTSVTQADVDAILEAGWSEEAVVHAVMVTALFNFMNRIIHGTGVDPMPDYWKSERDTVCKEPREKRLAANDSDIDQPFYRTLAQQLGFED